MRRVGVVIPARRRRRWGDQTFLTVGLLSTTAPHWHAGLAARYAQACRINHKPVILTKGAGGRQHCLPSMGN